MAVQFVLGRSGTGKSRLCIDEIIDSLCKDDQNCPLILLVPEQATYQAEKAILSSGETAGYSRLEVLSFERLKFKVIGERVLPVLSTLGREMILHKIIREKADSLEVFGSLSKGSGISVQAANLISELHRYSKEPEDVLRLTEMLKSDWANQLTCAKFRDIGLIFREYLGFIEGRFDDPDMQLREVCKKVADADFVKGAKIWVDGFAGFSTTESALLMELLKVSSQSKIALCLDPVTVDPKNLNENSLFYPTEKTYAQLVDSVKQSGIKLAEPIILDEAKRFVKSKPLEIVEKNLFEFGYKSTTQAEGINIISAANVRTESAFIAKEILRLVKDQGYRYRDIAVIVSDIQQYQHYISAYFTDYGIPFFIDHRRLLNKHAVIGFFCSAFKAIASAFETEDVIAYLKSEFCQVEKDDVNLLENYCLAFGVSGRDWIAKQSWDFAGSGNKVFDDKKIDAIRKQAVGALMKFKGFLTCNEDGKLSSVAFTNAIFDFLESLGVSDKIADWIWQAQQSGDFGLAEEHRQFYDKFVDVFDKLAEVFGDDELTFADYFSIVNSAFSQLKLAFIPPTVDQVLVGSIERSRHPDLRAVFLAGATQKQFPSAVRRGGMLTDNDREVAGANNFELEGTASQSLIQRQYLAYIAFTRASERLYICYPACDEKGNAEVPSQFISNVTRLFETVEERFVSEVDFDPAYIHNKMQLADMLCSGVGKSVYDVDSDRREQLLDLLAGVKQDESLCDVGCLVEDSLGYKNAASIEAATVEKLLGNDLSVSATGLGIFANCGYRYFAKYVLELKERDNFKMRPLELGEFYHKVLDRLIKETIKRGFDIAKMEKEQLKQLLDEVLEITISEDPFISNFNCRGEHNAFIIRQSQEILEDFVLAMSELISAGDFRPLKSELNFGRDGAAFEIELQAGRKLSFNGKIDRIDVAEVDGKRMALVFDYKLNSKTFNWSQFYNGLDVQMPLYLLAVRKSIGKTLGIDDVAGAFYMPVKISYGKGSLAETEVKSDKFLYKPKGLFDGRYIGSIDNNCEQGNSKYYSFFISKEGDPYGRYGTSSAVKADDFELILKFTEKKVVELGKDIFTGKIDIRPGRLKKKSPCSNCEFKALCRFDWQINDYNNLKAIKDKVMVVEEIRAEQ
ncbi:MAG TPA: exodeoxyribonuclease V subunit gamma [Sedimentisphaerales bacterium]|nr:exodeoxyribonuclease V subunit gamma [Sedimentisphaerales bacterium]